jgi:hypothetical protein
LEEHTAFIFRDNEQAKEAVDFLLGLFLSPEDDGSMLLQNVCELLDYMALH